MCWIVGMFNDSLPTGVIQGVVSEMCDLLKHGGPDDEEIFSSENGKLVFGNCRLALTELSVAGHQP